MDHLQQIEKIKADPHSSVRVLSVFCPGGLKDLFEVLHRTAKIEEDFLVHRRDAWISAWVLSQVNGIRGTHATLATPRTSR